MVLARTVAGLSLYQPEKDMARKRFGVASQVVVGSKPTAKESHAITGVKRVYTVAPWASRTERQHRPWKPVRRSPQLNLQEKEEKVCLSS